MQTRRRLTSIAAATVLVAGGGTASAAAQDPAPLAAQDFDTVVPAGWSVAATPSLGATQHFALASPGAKVQAHAIPSANGTAVSIWSFTVAGLKRLLHGRTPSKDPRRLVAQAVAAPPGATRVRFVTAIAATKLGGEACAANGTLRYHYRGRDIVQRDVVCRRGDHVYYVESETDHLHANSARVAMRAVLGAWRWH